MRVRHSSALGPHTSVGSTSYVLSIIFFIMYGESRPHVLTYSYSYSKLNSTILQDIQFADVHTRSLNEKCLQLAACCDGTMFYLYKSGVRRGIDLLARLIDCYNDLLLSCKRFVQEMCWTYTHLFLFLSNMILMQKCDYLILIVRKLWIRRRQSARVFSNNEKDRSWPSYTWPKSEGFDHL